LCAASKLRVYERRRRERQKKSNQRCGTEPRILLRVP
jgi:hypothetical protein